MVLLVIDAQKEITNDRLYRFQEFVSTVKMLIKTARECGVEVIFVRHDDGAGTPMAKGLDGFEIYDGFAPEQNEKIFNKQVNSPFKDTGFAEYLSEKGETELIITGLQTDYCIDAAVKCGFERGYKIIVPQLANTTFDNRFMTAEKSYEYYNNFIWNGRYAECISADDTILRMKGLQK
ncbi:MAG: cysteine hydrolase [Oscillospiraceae bacterium]|nr:cysteine hydrolase [Oscillospiraceae bacterium]